jgi:hypothetical protein
VSVVEVRLSREVDALRAPNQEVHCGHATAFATIALIATSSCSLLATMLAVVLVVLGRDYDVEMGEGV